MVNILFEDNHLLVVNKPGGIPVQPDDTGAESLQDLVRDYIRIKYEKKGNVFAEACHRIDRPVSGVVVFAKTSKALSRINEAFRDKKVIKTYLAIVDKEPEPLQGKLIHWLLRNSKKNITIHFAKKTEGASLSELNYELISRGNTYFLLKVMPITGRTHQIRTQLSAIKCPIVGDVKYGYKRGFEDRCIGLHSTQIEFEHPTTKEMVKFTAPVPFEKKYWKPFEEITV